LIDPKDVVIAILGSASALAGFVLVFLGIIIASYQSYPGGVPEKVVRPYRIAGGALLGGFALGLVTVAVSLAWLVAGGSSVLYALAIALFAVLLVIVFGGALWATRMVLWQ